jgi:glycosidase
MISRPAVTMEFHVSRDARERYGLDEPWFSLTGNVVLADFATTRRLAYRMNQVRDAAAHPERAVHAAELHAMGLIDEILHFVARLYRERRRPDAMRAALEALERRVGRAALDDTLRRFVEAFPPLDVHRGGVDAAAYLEGGTAGVPHREIVLEELLLLWLANVNPAFAPFGELFDDAPLDETAYGPAIAAIGEFFATQPGFGPDAQSLVELLRSPAVASPHSLAGQLEYIRSRWHDLLGDFLDRLLVTLDVIREEEHARFMRFAAWNESRRGAVADYRGLESEIERFTPDRDWMPRVVMLAKSAHVWLDQLSRKHARPIARLDEIPDGELDQLARWGLSALWLIGLWERSPASRRIKQLSGNPDAGASAYSLRDYVIAEELGGAAAYERLRDRAWRRGIRLASDMVPNHMGLDSRWVIEHPDWFLYRPDSPYPGYRFDGPDLSPDPRVGLHIEDHYYDRTDAAVVFRRVDRASGETRHVYHGNDGTLMPWNDTAQLDYLNPAVREAVIRTILHVARHFPIIRFDAAMTLTKRHYQRLWFPEPGTGSAIPSRAEHGMTRAAFDAAMPVEFWREVVDRVAAEAPDTLLLAEAFWLMEGYFVRTLGMHRVYNSAFMNMTCEEENASYRSVIKNTLEFDPEILKRYVNFMNNPDERTAVDQFGKDGKYFGVCTMMVTMPGLPMFGHGQIEGFTERYGMEFRRAIRDETPDRWLIERHEREIFPLLHRRHVFAEVRDFLLYDFFTAEGHVNEDVFAYSNRAGDERALVLYHNRYASTEGWIRTSAAYAVRTGNGDEKLLRRRVLGDGLGLTRSADHYCVFRDQLSGLEYVRGSLELFERGLHARLDAFGRHVFLDFREVRSDAEHPWAELSGELAGRGVPSADDALLELRLRPVVAPFRALVNAGLFRELIAARARLRDAAEERGAAGPAGAMPGASASRDPERRRAAAADRVAFPPDVRVLLEDVEHRVAALLQAAKAKAGGGGSEAAIARAVRLTLAAILAPAVPIAHDDDPQALGLLFGWLFVSAAGRALARGEARSASRDWLHAWRWDRAIEETLRELGAAPGEAGRSVLLIDALLGHARAFRRAALAADGAHALLESLLDDERVHRLLQVNEFEGTRWFHKESWEALAGWMATLSAVEDAADATLDGEARNRSRRAFERLAAKLIEGAEASGYRLDRLAERLTARSG